MHPLILEKREEIIQACRGYKDKSFRDYEQNDLLTRRDVERSFEIIGESFNQASKLNTEIANQIPELRETIDFRNVLIHGYHAIDNQEVWEIIRKSLPPLKEALSRIVASDSASV